MKTAKVCIRYWIDNVDGIREITRAQIFPYDETQEYQDTATITIPDHWDGSYYKFLHVYKNGIYYLDDNNAEILAGKIDE